MMTTSLLLFSVLLFLIPLISLSMSLQLQGKRILVTGAGRGIGRAIALICYEEGAYVAISSRTQSELEETIRIAKSSTTTATTCTHNEAAGKSATATATSSSPSHDNHRMAMYIADVTQKDQVESMVQNIVNDWGGLDILINNAGGAQNPKGSVDTLSEESSLMSLLQLNVVGVHIVTNTVCRLAMQHNDVDTKRILNISSKAGRIGLPNYSFYVASKFAVEGMTSSWSKELQSQNIIVNSISPGMVNTKSFPKPPNKQGVRTPESIRDCLLFALSCDKEYTGHYVHADEYDQVIQTLGQSCANKAWKPIDEPSFSLS